MVCTIRKSALLFSVAFWAAVAPESVNAQAATGCTRDTAAPSMVVPIRPRDEPAGTTATPNVYRSYPPGYQSPNIRLRRIRPVNPNPK